MRHPLVDDVLQIGRGTGDPLDPGRCPGICAVRRLGDADVGVLVLLEQVDETQAVLRQDHAVGIEREHVVGIRDDEVGVPVERLNEHASRRRLLVTVAPAHQADVAVEVHRLVRLGGERRVALALEARDLGPEGPDEPPVELLDARRRQLLWVIAGGRAERRRGDCEVGGESAEHVIGDEPLVVVRWLVPIAERLHPGGGILVVLGEHEDRLGRWTAVARLVACERRLAAPARFGEQLFDLARGAPVRPRAAGGAWRTWDAAGRRSAARRGDPDTPGAPRREASS